MRQTPFFHILVLFTFLANTLGIQSLAQADSFVLPAPGIMVNLSPSLDPPILKGIKIHPENPFRFDFILDKGDNPTSQQEQLKTEATKLLKYFLASLTVPEQDLWVNLSPYEKERIIPQRFGLTEMGRDLLAEDYILKQVTASLIYPEGEVGRKFWKRIYEESAKRFGTTNIPVNTFNKVWIVPEKAVVYENAKAGAAYIVDSKLKVMLEQDYLSLQKHGIVRDDIASVGANIIREIVIPELTREVNEDKNFAQLRQVYNSLILAAWYKRKIKDSILEQVYADKNKVKGVGYGSSVIARSAATKQSHSTNDVELIYQRYIKAFKKGVYNYIKEEQDLLTQETIPRKYFSGGMNMRLDLAMNVMDIVHKFNLPITYKSIAASMVFLRVALSNSSNLTVPVVTEHRQIIPDQRIENLISEIGEEASAKHLSLEMLRSYAHAVNIPAYPGMDLTHVISLSDSDEKLIIGLLASLYDEMNLRANGRQWPSNVQTQFDEVFWKIYDYVRASYMLYLPKEITDQIAQRIYESEPGYQSQLDDFIELENGVYNGDFDDLRSRLSEARFRKSWRMLMPIVRIIDPSAENGQLPDIAHWPDRNWDILIDAVYNIRKHIAATEIARGIHENIQYDVHLVHKLEAFRQFLKWYEGAIVGHQDRELDTDLVEVIDMHIHRSIFGDNKSYWNGKDPEDMREFQFSVFAQVEVMLEKDDDQAMNTELDYLKARDELPFLESIPDTITTPQALGRLFRERREKLKRTVQFMQMMVFDRESSEIEDYEAGSALPDLANIEDIAFFLKIDANALARKIEDFRTSGPDLARKIEEERKFEKNLHSIERADIHDFLRLGTPETVPDSGLQNYVATELLQLMDAEDTPDHRERILSRLAEQDLDYPDNNSLVTDRHLLSYTAARVHAMINGEPFVGLDDKHLPKTLLKFVAGATGATQTRVATHLAQEGYETTSHVLGSRRLSAITVSDIDSILLNTSDDLSNGRLFAYMIDSLSRLTGAPEIQIKNRLAEMHLASSEALQNERDLLRMSVVDIREAIKTEESLGSNKELSDEEFYVLLVNLLRSLATVSTERAMAHLNEVMKINEFEDGLKKLSDERQRAVKSLQLHQLNTHEVEQIIISIPSTQQDDVFTYVVQVILQRYNLMQEDEEVVRERLAELGYNNAEDILAYRNSRHIEGQLSAEALRLSHSQGSNSLVKGLNEQLTDLKLGFKLRIADVVDLKRLTDDNMSFKMAIDSYRTAADILEAAKRADASTGKAGEGQHEREMRDNRRRLSLYILYLVVSDRGANGLRKLFLYLYPGYKEVFAKYSSPVTQNVTLPPAQLTYLQYVWDLFGLERLSEIGFPDHRITKTQIFLAYTGSIRGGVAPTEKERAYKALIGNSAVRNTAVTTGQFNIFLREQGIDVSEAMTSEGNDQAMRISDNDLTERYMAFHEHASTVPVYLYPIKAGEVVQVDDFGLDKARQLGQAHRLEAIKTLEKGLQLYWIPGERNKWALQSKEKVNQRCYIPTNRRDWVTFENKVSVNVDGKMYKIWVKDGLVRLQLPIVQGSRSQTEDLPMEEFIEEGELFRFRVQPVSKGEGLYRMYFRTREANLAVLNWNAVPDPSYVLGASGTLVNTKRTFANFDKVQGLGGLFSGNSNAIQEVYKIMREYIFFNQQEWEREKAYQRSQEIGAFLMKGFEEGLHHLRNLQIAHPHSMPEANINLSAAWQDANGQQFVKVIYSGNNHTYLLKHENDLIEMDHWADSPVVEHKTAWGQTYYSRDIAVNEGDSIIMTTGVPVLGKKDIFKKGDIDDTPEGITQKILGGQPELVNGNIVPGVVVMRILDDHTLQLQQLENHNVEFQAEIDITKYLKEYFKDNFEDIRVEAQFYDDTDGKQIERNEREFNISFSMEQPNHESVRFFSNIRTNGNSITSLQFVYPRTSVALTEEQKNQMLKGLILSMNDYVKKETGNGVDFFETEIVYARAFKFFKDYFEHHGGAVHIVSIEGNWTIPEENFESRFGLNWKGVAQKLLANGWAQSVNESEILLTTNLERDAERMSEVFGEDFLKLLPTLHAKIRVSLNADILSRIREDAAMVQENDGMNHRLTSNAAMRVEAADVPGVSLAVENLVQRFNALDELRPAAAFNVQQYIPTLHVDSQEAKVIWDDVHGGRAMWILFKDLFKSDIFRKYFPDLHLGAQGEWNKDDVPRLVNVFLEQGWITGQEAQELLGNEERLYRFLQQFPRNNEPINHEMIKNVGSLEEEYRQYYEATDFVYNVLSRVLDQMMAEILPSTLEEDTPLADGFGIYKLNQGLYQDLEGKFHLKLEGQEQEVRMIDFPGDNLQEVFRQRPALMVEVFRWAAINGVIISDRVLRALKLQMDQLKESTEALTPTSSAEMNDAFYEFLGMNVDISLLLLQMYKVGLLGQFLPEFENLKYQFEVPNQRFSVPMHSIYLLYFLEHESSIAVGDRRYQEAVKVYQEVLGDRDDGISLSALRMAILCHDAEKEIGGADWSRPHPIGGSIEVTPRFMAQFPAARLLLPEVEWLVWYHQEWRMRVRNARGTEGFLYSDLLDILELAKNLKGGLNQQLLNTYYLLTLADVNAIDPYNVQKITSFESADYPVITKMYEMLSEYLKADANAQGNMRDEWREHADSEEERVRQSTKEFLLKTTEVHYKQLLAEMGYAKPEYEPYLQGITEGIYIDEFMNMYAAFYFRLHPKNDDLIKQYILFHFMNAFPKDNLKSRALVFAVPTPHGSMLNVLLGANQDSQGLMYKVTGVLTAMGFNPTDSQVSITPQDLIFDRFSGYITGSLDVRGASRELLAKLRNSGYTDEADIRYLRGVSTESSYYRQLQRFFTIIINLVIKGVISVDDVFKFNGAYVNFRRVTDIQASITRVNFGEDIVVHGRQMSKMTVIPADRRGLIYVLPRILSEKFGLNIERGSMSISQNGAEGSFALTLDGGILDPEKKKEIRLFLIRFLEHEEITQEGLLEVVHAEAMSRTRRSVGQVLEIVHQPRQFFFTNQGGIREYDYRSILDHIREGNWAFFGYGSSRIAELERVRALSNEDFEKEWREAAATNSTLQGDDKVRFFSENEFPTLERFIDKLSIGRPEDINQHWDHLGNTWWADALHRMEQHGGRSIDSIALQEKVGYMFIEALRRWYTGQLPDQAQLSDIGGIDLSQTNKLFQAQNVDGKIAFHMDPAQLARLQNSPGFVPVIIDMQPLTDIKSFLGINSPVSVDKSV